MAEPIRPVATPNVPAEVQLTRDDLGSPRFTPRELRMIKEAFGHSFWEVMQDDESDDKFVMLAWLKLRREGYTFDVADLDDTVIQVSAGEQTPVDPTSGDTSRDSPPSAATGE
jgi:hypothetical protein